MRDYPEKLQMIARRQTLLRDEWERVLLGSADEIERLREALRKIACDDKTCNCMSLFSTTYDDRCVFGIARTALGEDK